MKQGTGIDKLLMHARRTSVAIGFSLALGACAEKPMFPAEVTDNVQTTFDYVTWRNATSGHPESVNAPWLKVQLGGRIVSYEKRGNGLLIAVQQLPIVSRPVYGPTETVKRAGGDYEFAFLYKGQMAPEDLVKGNKIIMVGITQGKRETVVVDGAPKSEPYLIAECVHIWKTGTKEISDFPYNTGGGYFPVEERTYCEKKK
jgi:hypothetical protein